MRSRGSGVLYGLLILVASCTPREPSDDSFEVARPYLSLAALLPNIESNADSPPVVVPGRVISDSATVHQVPRRDSSSPYPVHVGEELRVLERTRLLERRDGEEAPWYRVDHPERGDGWIYGAHLEVSDPFAELPVSSNADPSAVPVIDRSDMLSLPDLPGPVPNAAPIRLEPPTALALVIRSTATYSQSAEEGWERGERLFRNTAVRMERQSVYSGALLDGRVMWELSGDRTGQWVAAGDVLQMPIAVDLWGMPRKLPLYLEPGFGADLTGEEVSVWSAMCADDAVTVDDVLWLRLVAYVPHLQLSADKEDVLGWLPAHQVGIREEASRTVAVMGLMRGFVVPADPEALELQWGAPWSVHVLRRGDRTPGDGSHIMICTYPGVQVRYACPDNGGACWQYQLAVATDLLPLDSRLRVGGSVEDLLFSLGDPERRIGTLYGYHGLRFTHSDEVGFEIADGRVVRYHEFVNWE